MNEKDLRDCFAMFALIGVSNNTHMESQAKWCYEMADAMLEARNKDNDEEELGIAAVKPKRKYLRSGSR
jgi:hypothetical protein